MADIEMKDFMKPMITIIGLAMITSVMSQIFLPTPAGPAPAPEPDGGAAGLESQGNGEGTDYVIQTIHCHGCGASFSVNVTEDIFCPFCLTELILSL